MKNLKSKILELLEKENLFEYKLGVNYRVIKQNTSDAYNVYLLRRSIYNCEHFESYDKLLANLYEYNEEEILIHAFFENKKTTRLYFTDVSVCNVLGIILYN